MYINTSNIIRTKEKQEIREHVQAQAQAQTQKKDTDMNKDILRT